MKGTLGGSDLFSHHCFRTPPAGVAPAQPHHRRPFHSLSLAVVFRETDRYLLTPLWSCEAALTPQDWLEPDCDAHWHLQEEVADSLLVSTHPIDGSSYLTVDLFSVRCIKNEAYLPDFKFSVDQTVLQRQGTHNPSYGFA